MKTVIEMAREATNGRVAKNDAETESLIGLDEVTRFAALVIANHPPQSYMTWQEGYEAGKEAERKRLQAFMRQMIDAYSLQSDPSSLKARSNT